MTAGKRIRSGGRLRSAHIGQLAFTVNSTSACTEASESLVIPDSSWFGVSMARHRQRSAREHRASATGGSFWLYGLHAARAALCNPRRSILRAVVTEGTRRELERCWRGDLEVE